MPRAVFSFRAIYFREPWVVYLCAVAIAAALLPISKQVAQRLAALAAPLRRFEALAPIIAGAFALGIGIIPTIYGWTTPPAVHDEVSYLLAADTFLHGRLSNPTPVLWQHFQTMHELMVPRYASKFPPGQGMALAIGSLLGTPRAGAFGAVAIAIAATCWMMRAALPAGWALAGALLASVMPLFFFWGQTFWGGGVAMIGGALLAGAVLRALRADRLPADRVIDGLIIGIGASILMNSRPFEGLLVSLLLGTWLLVSALRGHWIKPLLVWSSPGALLVILPVLAWMGYYNYRVTHHVLRLPYAEHAAQYMHSPIFFWQKPSVEHDSGVPHLEMFFRDMEKPEWERQTTMSGFLTGVVRKLGFVTADVFRPLTLMAVALAGGFLAIRRRRPAALLAASVCVGLVLLHFSMTPWLRIQYFAVIAPLFVLFVTISLRELDMLWRGRPIGSLLTLTMIVTMPAFCLRAAYISTRDPDLTGRGRERIIEKIGSLPGNHVIFVQYPEGPQAVYEWVYNSADIDAQRVIWAHALDPRSNTELAQHYHDRSIWVLVARDNDYHVERIREVKPPP
jgi:hypothetical protein